MTGAGSSSAEWGPWIEHDGAAPLLPCHRMTVQIKHDGNGEIPVTSEVISRRYPGFFWRWRRVRTGWFRSELRRVCDNPAYAPIIAYRIRRPRALQDLIDLVENLPAPAPGERVQA
jgi:hypothetical protein